MSDDIGPGDVVESTIVHDGPLGVLARPGDRSRVSAVFDVRIEHGPCGRCGDPPFGMLLSEHPLPADWYWCVCGWKKIGGSRADTTALFRETLNVRAPEREDA